MFSLFIIYDHYCLATLYSSYSLKINLFILFLVPYSYKIFSIFLIDPDGFKKVQRVPYG